MRVTFLRAFGKDTICRAKSILATEANEQSITTSRVGEFFTTTNYVYEVDIIMLNLSYTFNRAGKKGKFIKSEFGEKEF